MTQILELFAGESRCTILPELGGSLAGWSVAGQALLRRSTAADIANGDRRRLAAFPLVPYSNRIGHGQFAFEGETFRLPHNLPPEPHAIHGTGWEDPWAVTALSASAVTLNLVHHGDDRWPWAFAARQEIAVTPHGLTLALTATSLADKPVPLAFGHHPYFDSDGAMLRFRAGRVWLNDTNMLPIKLIECTDSFDFSTATSVAARQIDHCFSGWDGLARITWADRPLAVELVTDLPAAVVYLPAGGDRFCFEPVPHSNNALNRADAVPPVPIIAPGDSFTARVVFSAVEALAG